MTILEEWQLKYLGPIFPTLDVEITQWKSRGSEKYGAYQKYSESVTNWSENRDIVIQDTHNKMYITDSGTEMLFSQDLTNFHTL